LKPLNSFLLVLIFLFLLFFLFICYAFYLYFNQSKYVYFPLKNIIATPMAAGFFYEDLMLKTEDGIKISAWYVPHENETATILFLHGNGGNMSHNIDFIEMFYKLKFSTFIIDYRGYGKSEGTPDEEGTYLDAEVSWNYLVEEKKINPSDIVVYGRSLGGAIGAKLSEKNKTLAVILDSTFTSIKEIGAKQYPFLPVRKFFKFEYSTIKYLKNLKSPVLVIHSIEDRYIPFSHAQKLYEAAPGIKELMEVRGDHNSNFIISRKEYEESIYNFIDKIKNLKAELK